MINLVALSDEHPLWIEEEEYEALIQLKDQGWSHCAEQKEWLAKLHYLRKGFKEGRIDGASFKNREAELVLNWLKKWV